MRLPSQLVLGGNRPGQLSTLLEPLEGEQSDYVLINHARWDGNLLLFMARQLPKKSFRSSMLANLKAHQNVHTLA